MQLSHFPQDVFEFSELVANLPLVRGSREADNIHHFLFGRIHAPSAVHELIPSLSHRMSSRNPFNVRGTPRVMSGEAPTNCLFKALQALTEAPFRNLLRQSFNSGTSVEPHKAEPEVYIDTSELEEESPEQRGSGRLERFSARPQFPCGDVAHSAL